MVRLRSMLVALAAALAGCGGGQSGSDGGGGTASGSGAAPSAVLAVTLDPPQPAADRRRIRLTWQTQGEASRYAVFVQRAAGEPFDAVGDATIGGQAAEFARGAAWTLDFPTAQVRVQACDEAQHCVDSNAQPLLDVLLAGIARVTPSTVAINSVFASRTALSADGATMAVAAPTDRGVDPPSPGIGSVFVFARGTDGRWAEQARLQNFDVPGNFGEPMALSGDGGTLVVGAYTDAGTVGGIDPPEVGAGEVWRGAVHVFTRNAQRHWQRQAFIKAATPVDDEMFGFHVVLNDDGRRLVVGAARRAYAFARDSAGAWRQDWIFESPSGRMLAPTEGLAVSGDGGRVALRSVGFTLDANGWEIPFWSVLVYEPCPCGDGWKRSADLRSAKPPAQPRDYVEDRFGTALAFSHDGLTLAVGAPQDPGDASDTGGATNAGAADAGAIYVFGPDGGGLWQRRAFLKARGASPGDRVGEEVALSADGRVIAAKACGYGANAPGLRRNHRADAQIGQQPGDTFCFWGGSGYVFELDGGGSWSHTAAAIAVPHELVSFDFFSLAFSADAQTLGLGAMTYTNSGGTGSVVVY